MSTERIAIVGIGLDYPDATSPDELWENVLAGRRAFRQRPDDGTRRAAGQTSAPGTAATAFADAGFRLRAQPPDERTGKFTVDDSGSPSLLAVANAVAALAQGDVDIALAGGTGVGCGMVVLMRERDAIAGNHRIYASVTGWGLSTDGDHRLAVRRAHEAAGYGPATVSYFEGQRTAPAGALSAVRRAADPGAPKAALGSVTGNLGHTGAADDIAGLIKAALGVHHQVIPPGTGDREAQPDPALYVPGEAALWPANLPVRAGVSATGLDGVSVHVAIEEAPGRERRSSVGKRTSALVANRQDAELLLVDAHDAAGLRDRATRLAALARTLSYAELTDLAATLAATQTGGPHRAAIVAGEPAEAASALTLVHAVLAGGRTRLHADGVYLDHRTGPPQIAYLFPGHGCDHDPAGALRRRFQMAEAVFRERSVPAPAGPAENTGPRVVAGSLAALRVLHSLGVDAETAVGHGLGELTALSWAGALDGGDVLRLAAACARVLARAGSGAAVARGLAERLAGFEFARARKRIVSAVTGEELDPDADPRVSLPGRLTQPPAARNVVGRTLAGADLAVDVGPGRMLSDLVAGQVPGTLVVALEAPGPSLRPILGVAAAAYALGAELDPTVLFADRVVRPLAEDAAPALSFELEELPLSA